jgi:hypothetical protein
MEVQPANRRSLDLSLLFSDGFNGRFPFVAPDHQARIGNDRVTDNTLESFGVRREPIGIRGPDDRDDIPVASGIAAVAADDAENVHRAAAGFLDNADDVGADISFPIASADGEDHQNVAIGSAAGGKPPGEACVPAFIVPPSSLVPPKPQVLPRRSGGGDSPRVFPQLDDA